MQASNAVSKDTPNENSVSQSNKLNPSHKDNPKNHRTARGIHPLADEYLTTEQFAQVIKTSPPVIRESRSSGMLFGRKAPEFIRIGDRKLLYPLANIVKWIESGKRGRVAGAES